MRNQKKNQLNITQIRDKYRIQIRNRDNQSKFSQRRSKIIEHQNTLNLRTLFEKNHQFEFINSQQSCCYNQQNILKKIIKKNPKQIGLLLDSLDFSNSGKLIYVLQLLTNITYIQQKLIDCSVIAQFIWRVLQKEQKQFQILENCLNILGNMLINNDYLQECIRKILDLGIITKIIQKTIGLRCRISNFGWFYSIIFKIRQLEQYFLTHQSLIQIIFQLYLEQLESLLDVTLLDYTYSILIKIVTLHSHLAQSIHNIQLSVIIYHSQQNLSIETKTKIFHFLSLYISIDKAFMKIFINQNGLNPAIFSLRQNNIQLKNLATTILYKCSFDFTNRADVKYQLTSITFFKQCLSILKNDVPYITITILEIYDILVNNYERQFSESLLEGEFIEILVNRLIYPRQINETDRILSLLISLCLNIRQKDLLSLRLSELGLNENILYENNLLQQKYTQLRNLLTKSQ